MFAIIACIDQNRGLGYRGELLFHLKTDLKFFKQTTLGHPVVMGRRTWESLPGKLAGRKNIVVSSTMPAPSFLRPTPNNDSSAPDLVISDFPKFLREHSNDPETYFVIGGASIYKQALPYADTIYLTEVDATAPSDCVFPAFDRSAYQKHLITEGCENGLAFAIFRYRKKVK